METKTNTKVHTIDATGKRLGILATEVAKILNGKDQTDFARHTVADVKVEIINASKLDIPEGKKAEIYQSYSGWPGGRKTETLEHLGERRGYAEVIRRTIAGMLPSNKLKKPLLKNLVISE
ncbi:MAG: uL13 family ribosomal protein [Candidatus Paceibacterota bacterium]